MKEIDYIKAIKFLTLNQIEVLRTLYYFPNSSATAKGLAIALGYKGFQAVNSQIGGIGKRISEVSGVKPDTYFDRGEEHFAYFSLVGPYKKDGWEMNELLCKALEDLKIVSSDKIQENVIDKLPTEITGIEEEKHLLEGMAVQVTVNKYERNQKARRLCISHYGAICTICGFDFSKKYGKIAEGYIQVHHIRPISEINSEYEVDPINDLITICANCHNVIHMTQPAMKIDDLKKIIITNCL